MGALQSAVSGLMAHQTMLDVAGNNLANVNTTAFKSSSVTFSELLSQTIREASGPAGSLGGTNPQQMGTGVGISSISRKMTQGNIEATGRDGDVAIDGEGYFVLNDGTQNLFTRIGSFAVDSNNTLVDPATGNKVQRIGTYGESDNFQVVGDSSIHVPWDASMPASATSEVVINGNLRSAGPVTAITKNKVTSDQAYTTGSGANVATAETYMSDLDQWTSPLAVAATGTLRISGTTEDGTVFTNQDVTWTGAAAGGGDTWQTVLDQITALFDNSTATINQAGKITVTDDTGGYSLANITSMTYVPAAADALTAPTFFELTTPGGNDTKQFNITLYDSGGQEHVMTGYFVKTDTTSTWDLVIPSIGGETTRTWSGYDTNSSAFNRRISGIQFNADGSYAGLLSSTESLTFGVQFSSNPGATQNIAFDLGTVGEFSGLTQFYSEQSTASAMSQDGYEAGSLASISIDSGGMVVGTFTNDVKKIVAAIQLAIFQNAGGLEATGKGYFISTANSGDPVASMASSGGTGSIVGKSLEKSNVDIATEFVMMMQAQNGYQANARTVRVANDVLRELTNLIR